MKQGVFDTMDLTEPAVLFISARKFPISLQKINKQLKSGIDFDKDNNLVCRYMQNEAGGMCVNGK